MIDRTYIKCGVLIISFVFLSFPGMAQEKILYALTINVIGGGSVSPGPGTYYYSSGTTVNLSATPTADWAFDHWEGSISETGWYAQVYMNGPKTVTAVFVPAQWRLTITHSGDATGTTFPGPGVYGFLDGQTAGINIGTSPGVYFGGWTGDAIGTDEFIQLYMNSDKYVNARFTSTGHILNVYIQGEGGATPGPQGNPHRYSSDVSVNVSTYQTNPLWRFSYWEGDIDDHEPISYILFNLSMDRDRTITAVFIEKPYYNLTIEIIGEGNVSLQEGFNTPIILTPGIHEYTYLEWTYIRCESIETTQGWKFLRWEGDFGDTSPTYPRCAFSMDKERRVRCIFTDKTRVPNVVGMSQGNANSAVTNAWLTVGNITQTCNDEYPSGYVFNQTPTAGTTVEIGSSVSLWLSTGPCPVTVPNVVGMTRTEAETTITSSRLALGTVTERCNSEIPAGRVISQSPIAGEQVSPGSKVNIIISLGPCPVTVPNILWQTQSTAESMITNAGLVIGIVTQQCDDVVSANRVLNQYPQAGQQVSPGSAVNFTISSGPCLATVPNVVSYTQTIARNIITTAGLVVGEVTQQCHPTIRAGIIFSQSPSAGEKVPFGSSVNIIISSGACNEGAVEGTSEGEGIIEGISEGTVEGEGEGESEGTVEGIYEGTIEGISEGTTEGPVEGISEGVSEGVEEGEGFLEGEEEGFTEGEISLHRADQNGDWKIDLRELLRVIQFFNTGGYHCEEGTEDGYAPGPEGNKACQPHSSDYNVQDWTINLAELLRLIQFFNTGGYHPCPGTGEDNYCPGT